MDYEKKDFRKLYEDLVKSDWFKRAYHDKSLGECPFDIPGLTESEDERIRKVIVKHFEELHEQSWINLEIPDILAWLEKQKERGPLTKEEEYILHRIIEYLEDETCPSEWISLLHDIYCLPYEKQKYAHYTKRNALFDKCVENCDPEVMKKVSDEVDEMLEKEQKPISQEDFDTAKHEALWGEQKSAEHSAKGRRGRIGTTPEHIRKKAENFLSKMEPPYDADDICSAYETGAMESIKQEWSEEDERILKGIIGLVDHGQHYDVSNKEMISWLKSLRPSWKPSDK